MPTNDDDSDDETAWTPPPDLAPAQLVDWQQARAHVLLGQAFRSLGRNVNEQTNVIRPLVEREVRLETVKAEILDARIGPVRMVSIALAAVLFSLLWVGLSNCGADPAEVSREGRLWWNGECVPSAPPPAPPPTAL